MAPNVGHGRQDAGAGDCQREPAIAEPAAHEIGRGDVAVLVRDRPQPREHDVQDRVDHYRVRYGEEADRAGAEHQRRHRDEGVGGVEVAANQEPGNDGAEAAPAKPPFMQHGEIAAPPVRGDEADPGDQAEQQDKDDEGGPVDHAPRPAQCSRR
jgi:hypothetical protein